MSARKMHVAAELKRAGAEASREEMSLRVIAAVAQFDGSYKAAMQLAGRLKAITQMAASDDYWSEQVSKGYDAEATAIRSLNTGEKQS